MELILLTIAGLLFSALVGVAGGTVCFLIGSLLDWGYKNENEVDKDK